MRIAYFSSVLNHHQIEFCDNMYRIHGDEFTFVSTMDIEQQRIALGYKLFTRPYNLLMHISDANKQKAKELFQNADIVILGVLLEEWLQQRLKSGKITFLHKERLFKQKPSLYWRLRCQMFVIREYWPHRSKPFYMLAASAYSLADYRSLGFFVGKTFAWGYFPPFHKQNIQQLNAQKQGEELRIFWAGRTLEWKNPQFAIYAADHLRTKGIRFHLHLAGNGPLDEKLKNLVNSLRLNDCVTLCGALPPDRIREYMERANIYLFTSNREEGFGAVLTEAMNSACAVIASATAGGTNLLIRDRYNGLVYHHDSLEELFSRLDEFCENRRMMEDIGQNAYATIRDEQNASVAAERFSAVVQAMYNNVDFPQYADGPMRLMK